MSDANQTNSDQKPSLQIMLTVLGILGAVVAAMIGILPWLWPTDAQPTTVVVQHPTPVEAPPATVIRVQPPAVGRGQAVLFIESVTVADKNAQDEDWDVSAGKPDPFVEVVNLTTDQKAQTPTRYDTLTATYNTQLVRVNEGDTVQLIVYDSDLTFSDVMGKTTRQVTRAMLKDGRAILSFDQVVSLKLRLE